MDPVIGLLGALIGAFVAAHYPARTERKAQLESLAKLLDEIADCLAKMEEALAKNIVPTTDGNRLQRIIGDFKTVIARTNLDRAWRENAEKERAKVELHLSNGKVIDDYIRGHILRLSDKAKARALHEMRQTSGRIRGDAALLRQQS